MSPPKTDAFADLLSGKLSPRTEVSSKLSMGQRLGSNVINGGQQSKNGPGHYQDLDLLLGGTSTSSIASLKTTSTKTVDVDELLGVPTLSSSNSKPRSSNSVNSHTFEGSSRLASSVSLLDDEFTDAFSPAPSSIPTPHPTPIQMQQTPSNPNVKQESRSQCSSTGSRVGSPASAKSSISAPGLSTGSTTTDDKRDGVLAELVDIGFSIEASNEAIDRCGYNLQTCVNYIMSKAAGNDDAASGRSSSSSRNSQGSNNNNSILTKSLNDVSVDIFNKASNLLYKSKKTVIKNLAEFQSGVKQQNNDVPAWMRDQHRHKANASESNNGEQSEEYGTDEENINLAAIEDFIRKQKLNDKERAKHRFDNLKSSSPEATTVSSKSPPIQESSNNNNNNNKNIGGNNRRTDSGSSLSSNGSRPSLRSQASSPAPLSQPQPQSSRMVESDLLGLGSPSDRFRSSKEFQDATMYVSSSRRRQKPSTPLAKSNSVSSSRVFSSAPRLTVNTPLNQFHQSDYEVSKLKATEFFSKGDYQSSLVEYQKCLGVLPEKHELRVIILSNLLINLIKLGDYKQALNVSEDGLALISKESLNDATYVINDKSIKAWYTRLLSRKAEALEMLEQFAKALEAYTELISLGMNDKKIMDGRRRVNNIINPPPKNPPVAAATPSRVSKTSQQPKDDSSLKMVRAYNENTKREAEEKFALYDDVQGRLFKWSNGKEDNIRTLLISLPSILPERLGFPFLTTKKITLNDLMLPKKVKINYMKVIGCLHPDKTQNLNVEDKMICQGVFVILNKSWDIFKEQNGLT